MYKLTNILLAGTAVAGISSPLYGHLVGLDQHSIASLIVAGSMAAGALCARIVARNRDARTKALQIATEDARHERHQLNNTRQSLAREIDHLRLREEALQETISALADQRAELDAREHAVSTAESYHVAAASKLSADIERFNLMNGQAKLIEAWGFLRDDRERLRAEREEMEAERAPTITGEPVSPFAINFDETEAKGTETHPTATPEEVERALRLLSDAHPAANVGTIITETGRPRPARENPEPRKPVVAGTLSTQSRPDLPPGYRWVRTHSGPDRWQPFDLTTGKLTGLHLIPGFLSDQGSLDLANVDR